MDVFHIESSLFSKKFCYKVSLCEIIQPHSCKAFTGVSIGANWLLGTSPSA